MELVQREIDRLSDLVRRLLVFSKPSARERTPSDVNGLLQNVLTLLQPELTRRGVALNVTLSDGLPKPAIDQKAIEQVFLNIVTNAFEAMPKGGALTVGTNYVPETEEVVVTITDTGKGIPAEIRGKIFDPFFTTKEQGAGLGLSIAYEIVHAHEGKITFNECGGGPTTCTIALPEPRTRR
jgi:signal transduction histidine kinase